MWKKIEWVKDIINLDTGDFHCSDKNRDSKYIDTDLEEWRECGQQAVTRADTNYCYAKINYLFFGRLYSWVYLALRWELPLLHDTPYSREYLAFKLVDIGAVYLSAIWDAEGQCLQLMLLSISTSPVLKFVPSLVPEMLGTLLLGKLLYGEECSQGTRQPIREGGVSQPRRCAGVSPAPRRLVMALPLTAQCICSCLRTIWCQVAPHCFMDSTNRITPECSWDIRAFPPCTHQCFIAPTAPCHLHPCVLSSLVLLCIACSIRDSANSASRDRIHAVLYLKRVTHIIYCIYLLIHLLITAVSYY